MSLSAEQLSAVSLLARGMAPGQVARELGISERTLFRWKKLSQFNAAIDKIEKEATKTVIKQTAADLGDLALEHLQAHQVARKLAQKVLGRFAETIEATTEPEDVSVRSVNLWSQILCRHIEGERVAASLDYLNIDKAIGYLTSQGYEVSIPEESSVPDSSLM
jgi:transposase-like protein